MIIIIKSSPVPRYDTHKIFRDMRDTRSRVFLFRKPYRIEITFHKIFFILNVSLQR